MALYSGASQRILSSDRVPHAPMAVYNRVNLHVTAGHGSPYSTFNQPNAASSHFFVYQNGDVEQFVDTKYRAEADLDGNDATVSIETEGGYPSSVANTEEWTSAQLVSLASLLAWLNKTHGIALTQASSSKEDSTSKGVSWHRLGIDGNFPDLPSILAGRKQRGGGMHYSNATGKVCPGNAKIEQIPGLISQARLVAGGGGGSSAPTPPAPKPDPKPAPSGDLDIDGYWGEDVTTALQKHFKTEVDGEVWHQWSDTKSKQPGLTSGWKWDTTQIGSPVIKAIQKALGVSQDGLIGTTTVKALEKHYGYEQDGVLDGPSLTIKAMQKALNAGKF